MNEQNKPPFGMSTIINGLEIITGETVLINVRLSSTNDQRIVMAYEGEKPYITLVKDEKDGKIYTGVEREYDSIQESVEGHNEVSMEGMNDPERIRHSTRIRKLVDRLVELSKEHPSSEGKVTRVRIYC